MSSSRLVQALILASTSVLATTAASAQDAPAPVEVASADTTAPDAIIVTGRRFTQGALADRKNAINIVNTQSAEDIAKYPDFNAAESLSRIPGVTISADTGEGRFVVIRGVDSNLNGTTFGGVTLLNTQPGGVSFGGGGRAVELDTIPVGSVDQLLVRKTGVPDQEAEGIGGSVDIIPRTAQGIKHPFLEGTLGGGYEPAHGHAGIYRGEIAAGARFGPDQTFGLEVNANYHEDARGFDDAEPGLSDPVDPVTNVQIPLTPTNTALNNVSLRRYNYNRRRFGIGSELTYDPTPQSHFYIRADDAGYTERVNRQILSFGNLDSDAAGNTTNIVANTNGGFSVPNPTANLQLRDEQETAINFVTSFGGHNDLGKIIVDYQGSFTSAVYHKDYDYNSTFKSNNTGFTLNYQPGGGIDGLPSIQTNGFNPSDTTQFTLSQSTSRPGFVNSRPEGAHDQEWAGRVDFTVPIHFIGENQNIKFGGKLKLRDKRDTQHLFTYFPDPRRPETAGLTPIPVLNLTKVQGPGPYANFYDGQYSIGYIPNYLAIRALIPDNESRVAPLVADKPLFNDTENVYAGYVEYEGKLNKFGYLVGVRIENTDGTYRSPDTNGVASVIKQNYTDFFPNVQLRYDLSNAVVLRASYSTAISRPGFNQLQAGFTPDPANNAVSAGNPGLKPITDDAFDLSAEYYLPHAGVFSIGLFDKEFHDYILNTLQRVKSDPRLPNPADPNALISITGNRNVGGAFLRGIEAQYEQRFTSLPGVLSGLGFSGNVTYVHSHILLRPGQYGGLPGTSELTWNLAGFYEKGPVEIRISAQNAGASIFGVGNPAIPNSDTYTDDKTQVDFNASYAVKRYATVYFQAKNLSNGALRYYEGFQNRVTQREFYDQSFEAGLKLHF